MSIAWQMIFPGRIYYCTDAVGFEFLMPGSWVHGELEIVDDVQKASSRTMSEPDVILRGWTVGRLWMIWSVMFGSTVVMGLFLARMRWVSSEK